jgi:hypothetical protein
MGLRTPFAEALAAGPELLEVGWVELGPGLGRGAGWLPAGGGYAAGVGMGAAARWATRRSAIQA